MNRKIFKNPLIVLMMVVCLAFSVLVCRLFYLQIIKGEEYAQEFELKIRKTQTIKATRGKIYDRNGNLLAYNELAYSVTIEDPTTSDQSRGERNKIINGILEQVRDIVTENGDSVISSFGIILDSSGNYQFSQNSETQRLRFVADVYGYASADDLSEEQRNQTADEIIEYLCTDDTYGYGLDPEDSDRQYILDMVNMRYAMQLNSYQQYVKTTLAMDVSEETAAGISERKDELSGVDIAEDSVRKYVDSEVFSTILGYTGQISESEYDALSEAEQENTTKSDIVGKSGLEKAFDDVLRGTNGGTTFYVDNLGNVTETVSTTEPAAGNDLYLTIDGELQKNIYNLIEEKLAGIILSRLTNTLDYDPSTAEDSSDILIPAGDAYYSFVGNYILDYTEFGDEDAGDAEKEINSIFTEERGKICAQIMEQLEDSDAAAYEDLSDGMQSYMDYVCDDLLGDMGGIIDSEAVDTSDEMYTAWSTEGSVSLYTYLNYAISQNWIDTSVLSKEGYSSSGEIYQAIVDYVEEHISGDSGLDKLIYQELIHSGAVTGAQIGAAAYEQGVLEMNEKLYSGLRNGTLSAFDWLCDRIRNLEITPGQLALEPCSAGVVVTDPDTGDVLACVSYPGYDSNRLANTMDTEYYSQLVNGMSNIFYNRATQEKTAPGSTFKIVSAVAALTEGVIDGNSQVYCTGEFTKVTPSPKCWIYPGAHGSLDVVGAIQNSCNEFFYEMGYRLGTDENGTYDSDLGTVYSLTLADKITDSSGSLIRDNEADILDSMDEISDSTWDLVQSGMEEMVNNSSTFTDIDFTMAGKTGTAQQSALHPDHALFVGYAPVDDPQISVAVRIAYGYSSSYAAEIGRDIARLWLEPDSADEVITGKAAELGEAQSGD